MPKAQKAPRRRDDARGATIGTLGDLTPDPANRRSHNPRNLGMLADALRVVGASRSIVIDEAGVILAGNGVVEAASAAGLTKLQIVDADGDTVIAVRRRGLTAAQKRQLAIYDNRTAELAEWNVEQLAADLQNGEDLTAFFLPDELATLLNTGPKAGKTDPDAVPEVRATEIQRGDLFALGAHRLLCGDATDAADVARVMGSEKADLLLTDPPYGQLRIFSGSGGRVGKSNAAACKPYGSAYQGEGDFRLEPVLAAAKDRYERAVIWGGNYFADVLPISTAWLVWDKRAGDRSWYSDCELAWSNLPTTARVFAFTWQGMIRAGEHVDREHPTQKPVQLMQWILTDLVEDARIILDLFVGSGTTLLASEQLGRSCRAVELSPQYVQVALDRWEAFTGQRATKVGEAVRG